MERFICIHGHFYQPPRENPWLEVVQRQESAAPYHDWNSRVTAECYAPNTRAKILDASGRVSRITNNYSAISHDVGPTLLKWLEDERPQVYGKIIEADRTSAARFGGHGSALAQAYNHMIMPLANRRDKQTQIVWGMRDFEHRYGRAPDGMWLPETAVDLESLDLMAAAGIRFTILEPSQAAMVRRAGDSDWTDVNGGRIDTRKPYFARLPSGRTISIFFYDGATSRAVAFEGLLDDAEMFADRLLAGFDDSPGGPQLVHIATDGESYGHHHRFGEMALARALDHVTTNGAAEITNYSQYLSRHPAKEEVIILENTSWSCPHGVERWRGDCGCNSGQNPGWRQEWRLPLRDALDSLRDVAASHYERLGARYFEDPWRAREEYIQVILDRDENNVRDYFSRVSTADGLEDQLPIALSLLEMQRHAMLMYTSCGWFFDDIAGIESAQVLQYAGRVVQLLNHVAAVDIEDAFLRRLEAARSNVPGRGSARDVYDAAVRPAMVDHERIAIDFAVSVLSQKPAGEVAYPYEIAIDDYEMRSSGTARLAVGWGRFQSRITRVTHELAFAAVSAYDGGIRAGVAVVSGQESYLSIKADLLAAFEAAGPAGMLGQMESAFGRLHSRPVSASGPEKAQGPPGA